MRRTIDLLNAGEQERDGTRVVISDEEITPETAHNSIRVLLAKAEKEGSAFDKIGDYLIVYCIDAHKTYDVGLDKSKAAVEKAQDFVNSLLDKGDIILPFLSHDRYIDVRNSAPLSIFPFPESARIKLITGAMFLCAFVNVSAVLRYFEQKGWKIVAHPEECLSEFRKMESPKEPIVARIRKDRLTIQLPYQLLARVGYEFLKPRTLLDICEAGFTVSSQQGGWRFANLVGEPKIWD